MAGLACLRDIRAELRRDGYGSLRAEDWRIADEMRQEWLSLSIDFSDLPADKAVPAGSAYMRRSGRFAISSAGSQISPLPEARDMPKALLDASRENAFLLALIGCDFAQLPLDAAALDGDWQAHAHLIRCMAGQPTPLRHRSCVEVVALHLMELVNARGGDISIGGDDGSSLTQLSLDRPLDGCILHLAGLTYQTAPIAAIAPAHPAFRDLLVIEFQRQPPSR